MIFNWKGVWALTALSSVLSASGYILYNEPTFTNTLISLGSVIGILFVLGVAFGWRHANLFGALTALFFGASSYENNLLGNAICNWLVVIPFSIWGWWSWCNNDTNKSGAEKRELGIPEFNCIVLATTVTTALLYLFMVSSPTIANNFSANIPTVEQLSWLDFRLMDSVTAILPIFATILLVNSYKEQWYLWLPYNILECIIWVIVCTTNIAWLPVATMRCVFLINSIIGYFEWNKK